MVRLELDIRNELLSQTIGTLESEEKSYDKAMLCFSVSIVSFLTLSATEIVIIYVYNRWVHPWRDIIGKDSDKVKNPYEEELAADHVIISC